MLHKRRTRRPNRRHLRSNGQVAGDRFSKALVVIVPIVISILAFVVSVATFYLDSRQTEFQRIALEIQKAQDDIAKRQLQINEDMAQLQKALAPPSVEYLREPPFFLEDSKPKTSAFDRPPYSHSYPDRARFQAGIGITSIQTVSAVYYGMLAVTATCARSEKAHSIYVAFTDALVAGGNGVSVGSIPDTTHHDIINPGLSSRLKEFNSKLSAELKDYCVREARVYGVFEASFVDVRSNLHHQYFDGYLQADMGLITREEWYKKKEEALRRTCRANLDQQAISQCARAVRAEF